MKNSKLHFLSLGNGYDRIKWENMKYQDFG